MTDLELAELLFKTDWPKDDWQNHIIRGKPDMAARRYVAMAEVARAALEADRLVWPPMMEIPAEGWKPDLDARKCVGMTTKD